MKKTIIALLSLVGMAAADTMVSVTENLTVTSTAISLDTTALTLALDSIGGASTGTYTPDQVTGATGFSPKIQFVQNSNDGCYWLLDITVENKTNSAITLTGMTLDMFSTTASGGTHSAGIGTVTTTLTYGSSEPATVFGSGTATLGANSASATATITGTYELAAKSSEEFTLKVERTQSGAFTGFASISAATLSYETAAAAPAVPEPTTATLSLLALAGLAARRRRK